MVLGGSNSIVLSAACHASPSGMPAPLSPMDYDPFQAFPNTEDGIEMRNLLGPQQTPDYADEKASSTKSDDDGNGNDKTDESALLLLSQSRLQWGVVRTPEEFGSIFSEWGEEVGHLSFGTRDDDVRPPTIGQWYA